MNTLKVSKNESHISSYDARFYKRLLNPALRRANAAIGGVMSPLSGKE
jgi:hypothetical protein